MFQTVYTSGFLICLCCRSQHLQEHFSGNLWNAQNILSVEKLWTTFSKLFNNFVKALVYFFLEYLQNFQKFLSWMLDLLLKIFSLTSMWLQVATYVCMESWLYSCLMSSSSPAHLFSIVSKLLWGQGCFTSEASTTLNLAQYFRFSNAITQTKPL